MGYMGFGLQKWIYTQKPRTIYQRPGEQLVKQMKQQSRYGATISKEEQAEIRKRLDKRFAKLKMTSTKQIIGIFILLALVISMIYIINFFLTS